MLRQMQIAAEIQGSEVHQFAAGKTTAIVEIILQEVKRGNKVQVYARLYAVSLQELHPDPCMTKVTSI